MALFPLFILALLFLSIVITSDIDKMHLSLSESSKDSNFKLDKSECKIENFEFGKELGRGNFGIVYKVRHIKTGKYYAAKDFIWSDPSKISKELKIIKNLNHPFIIKFHCLMTNGSKIIQIFDHVKGINLDEFIDSGNVISEEDFKIFASELILAFKYLQQQKISFIDLKPDNILIDESGHLKVVDFGCAKSFKQKSTFHNPNLGSKGFKPPEMMLTSAKLSNEFPLESLDWYSLGLTLYNLFYGHFPFPSEFLRYCANDNWMELLKIIGENKHRNLDDYPSDSKELKNSYKKSRTLSKEGSNLLKNLLNSDPKKRMEFVNESMMNHAWFSNSNLLSSYGIKTVDEWWESIYNKTITSTSHPIFYLGKECFPYPIYKSDPTVNSFNLMSRLRESSKITSITFKEKNDENQEEIVKDEYSELPIIFSLPKGMVHSDFHDISNFLFYEEEISNDKTIEIRRFIFKELKKGKIEDQKHFITTFMESDSFFKKNYGKYEILMNRFERLENQIVTLYELNIPFINKFVGIYICGSKLIQIFENVPGRNLSSLCKKEKPLNESDLIFYIAKLIIRLQELNSRGISWGNVSLENVTIDRENNLMLSGFENSQRFAKEKGEGNGKKEIDKTDIITSNSLFRTPFPIPEMIKVGMEEVSNYEIEPLDWYLMGCVIYKMIFLSDPYSIDFNPDQSKEEWNMVLEELKNKPLCLTCLKSSIMTDECKKSCIIPSGFDIDFINNSTNLIEGLMNYDPKERMEFVKNSLESSHPWFSIDHSSNEKNDNIEWWNQIRNGKIKPKIDIFSLDSIESCKKRPNEINDSEFIESMKKYNLSFE